MDSPQFETLVLTLDECVALVELNRPAKANSMSAAMWSDLDACFRWCDSESAVRVVGLAARGKISRLRKMVHLNMALGSRGECTSRWAYLLR